MPSDYPRLRRDLTWRRFVMEGQDSYIFKDEVSQAYTKLDAISGTLALQLDGTVSPQELLEFARERWPSLDFDEDYIADALADLKRLKFLDDPFERSAMMEVRVRQDRAQINASTFKNIFYIPMGTVNPDRFLTRTYPRIAFMFEPFFVRLGLALFAFSIYLVWLNRDHLAGGGPGDSDPARDSRVPRAILHRPGAGQAPPRRRRPQPLQAAPTRRRRRRRRSGD